MNEIERNTAIEVIDQQTTTIANKAVLRGSLSPGRKPPYIRVPKRTQLRLKAVAPHPNLFLQVELGFNLLHLSSSSLMHDLWITLVQHAANRSTNFSKKGMSRSSAFGLPPYFGGARLLRRVLYRETTTQNDRAETYRARSSFSASPSARPLTKRTPMSKR